MAEKVVEKRVEKVAEKAATQLISKQMLSKFPLIYQLIKVFAVYEDIKNNDYQGAFINTASAAVGCIPVVGCVSSIVIDVFHYGYIRPKLAEKRNQKKTIPEEEPNVLTQLIKEIEKIGDQPTREQVQKGLRSYKRLLEYAETHNTKIEEFNTDQEVKIGIAFLTETLKTYLNNKQNNSSDDNNKEWDWLYIMITTTKKLRNAGNNKIHKEASSAIADYFENVGSSLVFKVGYSKNHKLYQRIKHHKNSYGSKFVCAFRIKYKFIEESIHKLFFLSRLKLKCQVWRSVGNKTKPDGYTELYDESTLSWVIFVIEGLKRLDNIKLASRIDFQSEFIQPNNNDIFFQSENEFQSLMTSSANIILSNWLKDNLYTKCSSVGNLYGGEYCSDDSLNAEEYSSDNQNTEEYRSEYY